VHSLPASHGGKWYKAIKVCKFYLKIGSEISWAIIKCFVGSYSTETIFINPIQFMKIRLYSKKRGFTSVLVVTLNLVNP
jgi:hypothetical protein